MHQNYNVIPFAHTGLSFYTAEYLEVESILVPTSFFFFF